jgi:(1->4)-alpha-D-glucan 1-alpha-D-glucosylmutase
MKSKWVATYRVQLQPQFGFEQAAAIADYLKSLGVSHLYASPYLQAAEGSTHGYDVVDPSRVNAELGGKDGHAHMCRTLHNAGLGQMVDIVPNHMAISGGENPWWWDVLENGPSSRYALFFDVDWDASEDRWPDKILLPVLGNHYGRVLEAGELQLRYDEGWFALNYYENRFPIDPSSLSSVLRGAGKRCNSEQLAFIAESYARLPRPTVTAREPAERRHRDKAVLRSLFCRLCSETPEVDAAVAAEVQRLNADTDALDELIQQQNYRLALWRTASRDLGYRRFFDINDLAGLRVEDETVFRETHELPVRWIKEKSAQGLRIDHSGGLQDPAQYFSRLRAAWIVVEKILEPGEKLPAEWPVEGTTGYDFLNLVSGLYTDSRGEHPLTELYASLTGESVEYPELVQQCKHQVMNQLLSSEIGRLTDLFVRICERHRRYRDYTRFELREALLETAAYFPVYRTYISVHAEGGGVDRGAGARDGEYVQTAIRAARAAREDLDPELFTFLEHLLLMRMSGSLESELIMRFQQLTGPVMAKGVEDTLFYRFTRLIALNEVGGDPGRFGISPEEFHSRCREVQADHPYTLLASTTHDTKRSEDVRARLLLLSEIPDQWAETVQRWVAHNRRHRGENFPDPGSEYLFYQTLVGVWPIDETRLASYMEKANREAKHYTSWTQPNKEYEGAWKEFITAVMADQEFLTDVRRFVDTLIQPGRVNSLALLKLTAPGVPDIYQGTELWALSLVDPDNRRLVDYDLRKSFISKAETTTVEEVLEHMDAGWPKLWLIQ